ncbi:MAG: hypothetical protein ACRC8S_09445, partial [Fimbriiglobus sp.]
SGSQYELVLSDGAMSARLMKPTTIVVGNSVVTLNSLSIDTRGNLTGSGRATVVVGNTVLARSTFGIQLTDGQLTLNGSANLDLGIITVSLSGFLRANGTYRFAVNTNVVFNDVPELFYANGNLDILIEKRNPRDSGFFRGLANGYVKIVGIRYEVKNTGFNNQGDIWINGIKYSL